MSEETRNNIYYLSNWLRQRASVVYLNVYVSLLSGSSFTVQESLNVPRYDFSIKYIFKAGLQLNFKLQVNAFLQTSNVINKYLSSKDTTVVDKDVVQHVECQVKCGTCTMYIFMTDNTVL